uniref:RAP domain-containing protein n=1 Tax=Knipowitschia caucasica TaxID=637954 RepID=A0AAV2JXB2_KNICA
MFHYRLMATAGLRQRVLRLHYLSRTLKVSISANGPHSTAAAQAVDEALQDKEEQFELGPLCAMEKLKRRKPVCLFFPLVSGNKLLGLHAMKRRHLKLAGYKVVELHHQEWFPLLRKSRTEKLAYLHCKVFDQ